MKCLAISCWLLAVSCWSVARADEFLPRNPFWPQGFEGKRYPITAEPRFKPEPVKAEEPASSTNAVEQAQQGASPTAKAPVQKLHDPLEDPIWNDAVKARRFGSTLVFYADGKAVASVTINDRIYAVGDLVSANFGDHRFTWKIESLSTDGKIKLKRINYRKIGTNP